MAENCHLPDHRQAGQPAPRVFHHGCLFQHVEQVHEDMGRRVQAQGPEHELAAWVTVLSVQQGAFAQSFTLIHA